MALQIRLTDETLLELKAIAHLRGLSVSALMHQRIVAEIRAEKRDDPEGFRDALEIVKRKEALKRKNKPRRP